MAERRDYGVTEREAALKRLRSRRRLVRARGIAKLCTMFEPLVKATAGSYQQNTPGASLDDLMQVARVGLLEACNSFDPDKGAFPTHATWCIRDALSKYVETLGNPVRLPAWMIRRLPKLRRIEVELGHELLRDPTREELAARMKMPLYAIEAMLVFCEGPRTLIYDHLGRRKERRANEL